MQVSQNIREYDHAILLYSRASSAKISVWGPTPKMKMQMVKIELVCGAMAMGMEWDSLPRTSRCMRCYGYGYGMGLSAAHVQMAAHWCCISHQSRTNLAPFSNARH